MFPDRCSCGVFSLWHPLFPPIAGVFLSLHLCLRLPRLVALAVPTGGSGHGRGPGWVAGRVTSRVGSGLFPSGPRCRLLVSATPELQLPTPPGRDPQLQLGVGLSLAGCGGEGCLTAVVSPQRPVVPGVSLPLAEASVSQQLLASRVWPTVLLRLVPVWSGVGGPPCWFPPCPPAFLRSDRSFY